MTELITHTFGVRVQKIRSQRGLSQERLAEICDLHRTAIGRIERGETNITLINIHKIARGLGVPPAALLSEEML
jgi:transcriptional regulator with XRE-family HTH domain